MKQTGDFSCDECKPATCWPNIMTINVLSYKRKKGEGIFKSVETRRQKKIHSPSYKKKKKKKRFAALVLRESKDDRRETVSIRKRRCSDIIRKKNEKRKRKQRKERNRQRDDRKRGRDRRDVLVRETMERRSNSTGYKRERETSRGVKARWI